MNLVLTNFGLENSSLFEG